jgi:hypothetical protein
MSALPPDDMRSLRDTAFAARHPIDSMIARWQAIEAGAATLARLAGLGDVLSAQGKAGPESRSKDRFVEALKTACEWQLELAWQGVEDVEAIMQSGMIAIDVLEARGKDPRIPALALWREVDAAQRSVLEMLNTATKAQVVPAS